MVGHFPRLLAGAALAVFASGCVGTVPPPVSPAMLRVSRGATAQTLEAGRTTLTTRCASCHQVYPVAAYSAARWAEIVEEMAERTKLDASQQAALLAYLTAAHATPPSAPTPAG